MDPNQPPQTPIEQPQPPVMPQAPPAMQAPSAFPAQTVAEDPGKTLGIISLVTAVLGIGLVGLITGIIARSKSKKAGFSNGFALAGIIFSVISMVIGLLILVFVIIGVGKVAQKCNELGPGTHYEGGVTYTCGTSN